MGSVITTNIMSMNAARTLNGTSRDLSQSIERLSSGLRVNRAADDAAGLAVGEIMRRDINGMKQAARNAGDGISLVQTAEGALASIGDNLQRARELAMQAANGTYTDAQRANLDTEYQQILAEIDSIASNTQFNGINLLDGTSVATSGVTLNTVGSGVSSAALVFTIAGVSTGASAIGLSGTSISTQSSAFNVIASIDSAINTISTMRADLGAIQNRLTNTIDNLDLFGENLSAAKSRIMDLDYAAEMTNFTKLQILQQAGNAMLAQANAAPQSVLQLLG